MKKIHKYHNLLGFIYALIMLMPFASVLLRCCYVTLNKNAYLSYSNFTIDKLQLISNNYQNIEGYTYYLQYNDEVTSNYSGTIFYISTNINWTEFIGTEINYNVVAFQTYPNLSHIRLYDENNVSFNYSLTNRDKTYLNQKYIVYKSGNLYTTSQAINFYLALQTEGKLDNAFDYSLGSFLAENGTGNLNLTDWFTDLFLNRTTHNLLYINYINWYMNYALLISCVYLLFSVLMWFLTYARRLLSKGFNDTSF